MTTKTSKKPRILRRMHILCKELPPIVTDNLQDKSFYRLNLEECYTFKDPRTEEAMAINFKGLIPSTYGISGGTVLLARKVKGSILKILITGNISDREINKYITTGELNYQNINLEEHFVPIDLPFFRKNNKLQIATVVLVGFLVWLFLTI